MYCQRNIKIDLRVDEVCVTRLRFRHYKNIKDLFTDKIEHMEDLFPPRLFSLGI